MTTLFDKFFKARQDRALPCAPWCAYRDDPRGCIADVPGNCVGEELRTDLNLHDPIDEYDPDGTPDVCTVYAMGQAGRPAALFIGHNVLPGMELTPAEARQVIENLQLVLGQIGQSA
jgi:hypothetical protein